MGGLWPPAVRRLGSGRRSRLFFFSCLLSSSFFCLLVLPQRTRLLSGGRQLDSHDPPVQPVADVGMGVVDGDGLRASSHGARLVGGRTRIPGPFRTSEGVPAGFLVLEAASLDDVTLPATAIDRGAGLHLRSTAGWSSTDYAVASAGAYRGKRGLFPNERPREFGKGSAGSQSGSTRRRDTVPTRSRRPVAPG